MLRKGWIRNSPKQIEYQRKMIYKRAASHDSLTYNTPVEVSIKKPSVLIANPRKLLTPMVRFFRFGET